jgi:hypothetical protein
MSSAHLDSQTDVLSLDVRLPEMGIRQMMLLWDHPLQHDLEFFNELVAEAERIWHERAKQLGQEVMRLVENHIEDMRDRDRALMYKMRKRYE